MRRFILYIEVLILALAGLTACSGKSISIDENSNGQTIKAHSGDTLVVSLEGNPTTGYTWMVGDLDGTILKQDGDSQFKADSNLIGAGGTITYKFTVTGTGATTLKLHYLRPWESVMPQQEFAVTIVSE